MAASTVLALAAVASVFATTTPAPQPPRGSLTQVPTSPAETSSVRDGLPLAAAPRIASAVDVDIAYEALVPCMANEGNDWRPSGGCIGDALPTMIDELGPAAPFEALARHTSKDLRVEAACHGPAHAAGAQVFAETGDAAVAMAMANTTCAQGFLHGVLDGFGATRPSAPEFAEVAAVCASGILGARESTCYDGIGHAVWTATQDIEESAVVCASITVKAGRSACSEGILMQMFDPAFLDATYPLADAPAMLPEICDTWPEVYPAGDTPRDVCHGGGAAYVLMLPVTNDWYRRGDKVIDDYPYYKARIAALGAQCAAMAPDGVTTCTENLGRHMAGPLTAYDMGVVTELCSALGEFAPGCVRLGQQSVDARGDYNADGTARGAPGSTDTEAAIEGSAHDH